MYHFVYLIIFVEKKFILIKIIICILDPLRKKNLDTAFVQDTITFI